ncbi:MAG: sigma-54-dependent Fis family transcriptional regulator [Phycisphaerales bacterium]|nr:sigma-54-dependent Fis family transcriptional regulator [Phycisphaerales bacterium]
MRLVPPPPPSPPSSQRQPASRAGNAPQAPANARVLVVDDDPIVAESLAEFLRDEGYDTSTALDGNEALTVLAEAEAQQSAVTGVRPFQLVLSDVNMPGADGLALLRALAERHPGVVAVMLTGYGTIEAAVEAVRHGAADYLTKPVVDSELRLALQRALRQQQLVAENRTLKRQLETRYGLDSIVGSDPRMLKTYDLVEAVAPTRTTVLMSGESGTGKSLIARAIHQRSPRKDKPFVELACGSIPETLLESELFGHIKGAFTGAHADKAGKFLAANGGTLFLDEINSASPGMQLKLLRVLQERRFEPVGSNQTVEVDVRVILATNQSLEDLVAQGRFRQDLYYRINVVKIDLPPLRERTADIGLLAMHFLAEHAQANGKAITTIDSDALDALRRYPFPGNVRELSNIIERAVVLCRADRITPADLPPALLAGSPLLPTPAASAAPASGEPPAAFIPSTGPLPTGATLPHPPAPTSTPPPPAPATSAAPTHPAPGPLTDAMREPERQIILAALRAANWNRAKAAQQLHINRTTLYKKLKSLGLDLDEEERKARAATPKH